VGDFRPRTVATLAGYRAAMRTPAETTSAFDSPVKARIRRAIVGGAARLGVGLEPLDDTKMLVDDDSTRLPELVSRFEHIPGMLPVRRCVHLYLLAFGGLAGDVIEIGSWQGKATAYLAQACADTRNGLVHAIDTFLGNPGHEKNYYVNGTLANLEQNFRANIESVGLTDHVITHASTSEAAIDSVRAATQGARLLFIDGEHTYDAVSRDLALYAELVVPGGVIVLDDYSPGFAGDVKAVREHVAAHSGRYGRPFQQRNTLVLPRLHA
jgi:predicted O-methyltransferase YrrM